MRDIDHGRQPVGANGDKAMGHDPEMPDRSGQRSFLVRLWPLAVLAGLLALVLAMGWHRYLSLEHVALHLERLQDFISANLVLAVLLYMLIYAIVVAVSIPGGAAMTLAGGLLFGPWLGAGATVVAATVGATLVFLIVKTSLGEPLAAKAGPWLAKLREGFKDNALSYLLFLRLVPAFPFAVVNLAPALLGVPLRTYVIGTFLGIIPGTLAYAYLGAGLESVIAAQRAPYAACLAAGGGDTCRFEIDPSSLVTRELVIALALLSVVALIPVAVKAWRRRRDRS